MGLLNFFKKINVATRGQDPNTALFAELTKFGLQVIQQETAFTELAGTYGGFSAAMTVDATAIMGASRKAYSQAASLQLANLFGNFSKSYMDFEINMQEFYARERMQSAQILYRWTLQVPKPTALTANIGRDKEVGNPIGHELFGQGDQAVLTLLNEPSVSGLISKARFNEIKVKDQEFMCFWAPQMREYQKVAASPQLFGETSKTVLDLLVALANKLK